MRQGLGSFRRKLLWRLLCGGLGGVACASEIRAADSPSGGGASVEAPTLRLTLALGGTRKPTRRPSPSRASGPAAEGGIPLRMTLTLVPRSGDVPQGPGNPPAKAAVPAVAVSGTRASGGERIGVTAVGPANGLQDDDADDQPAASGGSAAPSSGATLPRQPSPVARDVAPAARDASALPDLEGLAWQMAPIRWTGNTQSSVNSLVADDGGTATGLVNSVAVNANSFIVAPWLGQWRAGFIRFTGDTNTSGTGVKVKSESESNTVTGGVTLVPTSDFPFEAQFSHNWSAASAGRRSFGLDNLDASATSFDLYQKYRTNGGRDNYSARYTNTTLRNGKENTEASALRGDYSGRREFEYEHLLQGEHLINAGFSYIPETSFTNGGSGRYIDGEVTHNWKFHEELNIANRLSIRSSSLDVLQGNALQRNDSNYLLGTTSFSWRPFEEEPLFLQGGANIWSVQTDTGILAPIEQDNFNVYLTGAYTFNRNMVANAGIFASTSSFNQVESVASSGPSRINTLNSNVDATYNSDPVPLGNYFYNWRVGGGFGTRLDNLGLNLIEARASGGHSINRTFVIDPSQSLGFDATQGITLIASTEDSSSSALAQSAGVRWNATYGEAFFAGLTGNLSHIVTNDAISSNAQSLNMTVNGNLSYRHQFSPRADFKMTGVLTWTSYQSDNVQRQTLNQVEIDGNETRYSGSLIANYNHIAPFSVRNLNYNATLFLNFNQNDNFIAPTSPRVLASGTRAGANVNASRLNLSTTLQQELRYQVGRLSFQANVAVINTDNGTNYSLYGSMNRAFSGFFDGRW